MVEGGGLATSFPVVFFDGEREIDIGHVKLHPNLVYKTFQSMLAQGIGISPNQISIYLIDRNNSKSSKFSSYRRKIPITGKANFAQICKERECCVLVVLKRSRKARGRKGGKGEFGFEDDEKTSFSSNLNGNVVLLRRNQVGYDLSQKDCPVYVNQYGLLNTNNNNINCGEFPIIEEFYKLNKPISKYFCEECLIAEKKGGGVVDFHHCVNDLVLEGFRGGGAGPIGPIRR
ncbi:hypothetical protein Leryth_008833 [Lithospermum erythrorhizon]|nr:hypothetical protein Leryth_008833 [Lithospermum erythrorhizon]